MDPAFEEDSFEEVLDSLCPPVMKGVPSRFQLPTPACEATLRECTRVQDDVSKKAARRAQRGNNSAA
jgi:hypothetical protein